MTVLDANSDAAKIEATLGATDDIYLFPVVLRVAMLNISFGLGNPFIIQCHACFYLVLVMCKL